MGPLSNWNLWVIGTLGQLGPLGNWEIRTFGQLGQNSKYHTITVIKDVISDNNGSGIRICTRCENDLLASYYCIECSEHIFEQCIDAHKKS